ncbi:MAG: 4-phosphoerythronate dehydrogenase [Gammaproteobacteria bacterium]|nr:4-phosphoerythronate dehydrogenase [Gammaproteobacteria bacterium]
MQIVADQSIPYLRHYFAGLGELVLLDGRSINPAAVKDADILLVRTVTRVDARLLEGSRVRLVGSPTSGIDHVDVSYLAKSDIGFADARGCNARSVAEYVLSSLFVAADSRRRDLSSMRAGVVGYGHVGSQVSTMLETLGIECRISDPPLRAVTGNSRLLTLEEVLDSEIITLHVPLTSGGTCPTRRMINAKLLSRLRDDVVLINTARGDVVDEPALVRFLDEKQQAAAILDVWSNEPVINPDLLARAFIATPHIAGYSLDARLRATRTVYRQLVEFLGRGKADPPAPELPPAQSPEIHLGVESDPLESVGLAVLASYDVRSDSAPLQAAGRLPARERGELFSGLRNNYPGRREFSAHTLRLGNADASLSGILRNLGFNM